MQPHRGMSHMVHGAWRDATDCEDRTNTTKRTAARRGGGLGLALWTAAVVVLALFLLAPASAAPHRQKRVSDQRLAELETRVALNRLKGIVVTVPVGFGKVDPDKLGRRRRSEDDRLELMGGAGGAGDAMEGDDGEGEEAAVGAVEAEAPGGRLAELLAALEMQRLQRPQLLRLGGYQK
ncbi:MraZ protein [Gryllus bimaculatus]|nr:MraZ protein [Gryllus bimaculatus]